MASMNCEFHRQRVGVEVPAYRIGMCRDCFEGRPIKRSEMRNIDTRPLAVHWDAAGNLILPGAGPGHASIAEHDWDDDN